MGYIDRMLAEGEEIKIEAHRHKMFMILKVVPYVLLAIVLIVLGGLAWAYIGGWGSYLGMFLLIVSLVPLGIGTFKYLQWKMERYVVTNYRILQVEGILNRKTFDSALEKVNDVETSQSVFGRMFDFGDVKIITGSDTGLNELWGISSPFTFKKALMAAKLDYGTGDHWRERHVDPPRTEPAAVAPNEQDTRQMDPPPATVPGTDTPSTVVALTELRNAGVISQEEFEEKMGRLVERPRDQS